MARISSKHRSVTKNGCPVYSLSERKNASSHLVRSCVFTIAIWALQPASNIRAEGSVTYKYQRWAEDDGRVQVDAHYAQVESSLSAKTKLRVIGLIDTIAGATPSGQPLADGETQVPLSTLTDRREAGQLEISHSFGRINLVAGYADSRESDYLSKVWSLNTQTNFNEKNTTLLLGYASADDEISAAFFDQPRFKTTDDMIIGITQLLSPRTTLTANLSYGRADGYLSDPYKIVAKNTEVLPGFFLDLTFPEKRPELKTKWVGYVSANHAVESLNASLEASYRWLDDSWGTTSQTLEFAWFQRLGERLVLRPAVRFYQQSAADFYYPNLNSTTIDPQPVATGRSPYFSSDYRLSKMRTWMVGINASWELTPHCRLDTTLERYLMQGRDETTSASAYADANVISIGLHYSW